MGFHVTKPVSVWNREVKADFRSLLKALSKAAANGFSQKWDEVGGDFGEIVASLNLDRKPEELCERPAVPFTISQRSIGNGCARHHR